MTRSHPRKPALPIVTPHFSVENPGPNDFRIYGHYADAKGKARRFLAAQTWSQERVDKWLSEWAIAPDGMLCAAPQVQSPDLCAQYHVAGCMTDHDVNKTPCVDYRTGEILRPFVRQAAS